MTLDSLPDEYVVDVLAVWNKLSKAEVHKAVGPDGILNELLK